MKFIKRLIKYLFRTFLVILTVITLTLFSFWVEIHTDISLPEPTGKYEVGRTTLHWVDTSRVDSLSPPPYSKRELIVWVWYPATVSNTDTLVPYDRAPWEKDTDEQGNLIFRLIFARDGSKINTHSYQNPQLSDKQTKFPVLLMKSGIGTLATDYTTLAEDLASHGYIVVGSDAPYSTFVIMMPDGRVINRTHEGNPGETASMTSESTKLFNRLISIWTDDAHFVLNKLEQINSSDTSNKFFNRIDTNSIGIFGHSFGGATAAQFCATEPRCKAGINLDGSPYGSVIETGMDKPFMFLLADHAKENDPISLKIKSNIKSIYNSVTADKYWFYLTGSQHFNFSDIPYQKEWLIMRLSGATGSIGRRHGTELINSTVLNFFNVYLKDEPKTQFDSFIKSNSELNATTK
jgi:predicted dienelactone hydrolase